MPGELYTEWQNDKIPDNCKYPTALIQAAQNQHQRYIGGLTKSRKFKIGVKVIISVNADIQDRLINGSTGNITHMDHFSR